MNSRSSYRFYEPCAKYYHVKVSLQICHVRVQTLAHLGRPPSSSCADVMYLHSVQIFAGQVQPSTPVVSLLRWPNLTRRSKKRLIQRPRQRSRPKLPKRSRQLTPKNLYLRYPVQSMLRRFLPKRSSLRYVLIALFFKRTKLILNASEGAARK